MITAMIMEKMISQECPITLWISIWMKYTATPITTAAKAGLIKVFTTSCRYLRYLRRERAFRMHISSAKIISAMIQAKTYQPGSVRP